jgi:hypothetical protein
MSPMKKNYGLFIYDVKQDEILVVDHNLSEGEADAQCLALRGVDIPVFTFEHEDHPDILPTECVHCEMKAHEMMGKEHYLDNPEPVVI